MTGREPRRAGGKRKAVPTRYRRLDGLALDDGALERLQVPVRTFFGAALAAAFFVVSSLPEIARYIRMRQM